MHNKRIANVIITLYCIIIIQFIIIITLAYKKPIIVTKEVEVVKEVEVIKEIEVIKDNIIEIQPEITTIAQTSNNDFKSYMSYKAIKSKSSDQWKLQQNAYTNEDGFRCIDGIPLVAVGTGWGLSVGDSALVICDNGNSFEIIVGDIKADKHTDSNNKTTVFNNCRCEFIVDLNSLHKDVKKLGNVAILEQYNGYVNNIVKK